MPSAKFLGMRGEEVYATHPTKPLANFIRTRLPRSFALARRGRIDTEQRSGRLLPPLRSSERASEREPSLYRKRERERGRHSPFASLLRGPIRMETQNRDIASRGEEGREWRKTPSMRARGQVVYKSTYKQSQRRWRGKREERSDPGSHRMQRR